MTIGERLDANKGVGVGFDTLRILLAFAVVLWHCFPISYGQEQAEEHNLLWPLVHSILPIFFALSGFLVTGSAMRLTVGKFALSRVLRIVPALAVDTIFSIVVIGALATTLPLTEFFTDPTTAKYLLNIVGEIHYLLPGVFETHSFTAVNGSLWTIRPELMCYLLMFCLILFKVSGNQRLLIGLGIILFVIIVSWPLLNDLNAPDFIKSQYSRVRLVMFFVLGSAAFLIRAHVPYSPMFAGLSAVFIISGIFMGDSSLGTSALWAAATTFPLVYIMMFLGVTPLPKVPFFDRGDYSYGIYLYGFPIQQMVVHYLGPVHPLEIFAIASPVVVLLAIFSWHCVEKPTLRLRKSFSMAAKIEAERERQHVALSQNPTQDAEVPSPTVKT